MPARRFQSHKNDLILPICLAMILANKLALLINLEGIFMKFSGVFVSIIAAFLFFFAYPVEAADDPAIVRSMAKELHAIYQAGLDLRQKYNLTDTDQVKVCVAENRHLRTKAKAIRKQAQELKEYSNRLDLTLAADYAFTCAYCGGTGEDCQKIPPALENIGKSLNSQP